MDSESDLLLRMPRGQTGERLHFGQPFVKKYFSVLLFIHIPFKEEKSYCYFN